MKNKHLTLSDRITIQEMLERNQSFRAIATTLEKSVASISREIRRNRYKSSGSLPRSPHLSSVACNFSRNVLL